MTRGISCWLVALSALAAFDLRPAAGAENAVEQDAVARAWVDLDAAPLAEFEGLREALRAAGAAADVALGGLLTFDAAGPRGRRERARLAREDGDARGIALALAALGDEDDAVRADLTAYLGDRRLLDASADERVEALHRLALDDPAQDVRTAALGGLAAIDAPRALVLLDRLLDELAGRDRAEAARLLAAHAGARERLVRRVQAAFSGAAPRPLTGEVLGRLLDAYGEALMHLPGGGSTAAERLPLIAGRTHPDGAVRLAAGTALDALIAGLARQSDVARADALLVALGDDGIPAREIAYRRANLALTSAEDLAPAVDGAAAILAEVAGSDDPVDREWRVRGALLGAAAEVSAIGPGDVAANGASAVHLARARELLGDARRTLTGLLSERPELLSSPARRARGNDEQRAFLAHLDCLVDLWLATARLAAGGAADDAMLLSGLRSMHVRQLTAQALAAESGARVDLGGFQALLDDPMGPVRLVLSNPESRAWPAERALAVQASLGRALAGVSAFEMPGFDPASTLPAMRDPLADPERKRLLADVLQASFDGVLSDRTAERDRAQPDEDKLDRLLLNFRILASDLQRMREGDDAVLRRSRTPSDLALDLTIRYLEDGNPTEARALAERMKADLFAAGAQGGAGVSETLVARLEAAIGSAYMDEKDAGAAERSFRQAATRLEAYEQSLEARVAAEAGDPELRRSIAFALLSVRSQRADVLLSLAVNANVRKDDQEAALTWFEQAFELKQNDFMRVLLACYRARSGRASEARAVLREVAPVPSLYYNLACTHALLGDLDVAVDYLARELDENHATARSRERQAQWAREDPDLKALRGHPGFERLLAR